MEVRATSINRGELPQSDTPDGLIAGWDAAGVVLETPDASLIPTGARIAALNITGGGWAERCATKAENVAIIPDGISFEQAATLPVAGGTAMQALRSAGPVKGRRILVTGASGCVGRLAVQLAYQAGAHVIALVRSPEQAPSLLELGAAEVVVGIEQVATPVSVVLETVGGPTLVTAFGLLVEDGVLVSIGFASMEPASFPPGSLDAPGRILKSFDLMGPVGGDLASLLKLVASGRLDPQIGWQGSWTDVDIGIDLMIRRRITGKAVLTVA
jgi:NADPH2:quinone reductase